METPPTILGGLYVLEFAHADGAVCFEQRLTLNVGGEWLGRMPYLALCEDFEKPEFMVQYCNDEWEPIGIGAGYRTIEDAKTSVERSYHGITPKWIKSNTNKEEAYASYKAELKADSCSFCGRIIFEVSFMIGDQPRICNHCIDEFHEAIHAHDNEA